MLSDYVRHNKCGEYVHVDERSEHVAKPCGDCAESICDYPEPHAHGFACGRECPCDMGMSGAPRKPENWARVDVKPFHSKSSAYAAGFQAGWDAALAVAATVRPDGGAR